VNKHEQHEQTKASMGRRCNSSTNILTDLNIFQAFDALESWPILKSVFSPILLMLFVFTLFQDFENTLKDVVNAKRLSASKMTRLTEIVMKSLEVRCLPAWKARWLRFCAFTA